MKTKKIISTKMYNGSIRELNHSQTGFIDLLIVNQDIFTKANIKTMPGEK